MKDLTNTNYGKEFSDLGYNLYGWGIDMYGNKRRYRTSPKNGSGAIGYFDNLSELNRYLKQIKQNRQMETLSDAEWHERQAVGIYIKIRQYCTQNLL